MLLRKRDCDAYTGGYFNEVGRGLGAYRIRIVDGFSRVTMEVGVVGMNRMGGRPLELGA